ncbi:alpha-amylase family glycosyl hydrolase [Brevundimonas lutea]|uniref:alpha-amylase family glycosyl hydrolase n=1 Tax=Brevundimonas lutea TaxID=2293980 RepID=UPI00196AEA0E|nr:alpha-amylase family glycosyl hydrolase [Brevundimonas lutea]
MSSKRRLAALLMAASCLTAASAAAQPADSMFAGPSAALGDPTEFRARPASDEVIYFVLPDRFENADPSNDRGGLEGDRLTTGFDPTHKGFFHGGDLSGLIAQLDYIQGLGATAIWLGPIYQNKPVQGSPGNESAGYHGYWITDFTRVDAHFGENADMKAFVDAAHARGMKVYLDIITNHTADVIKHRECPDSSCTYRSRADYPYSRQGGVDNAPINEGFLGDHIQTAENFARLTRSDYAYTPFVPDGEEGVKTPAWLNDPIYYHNRGNFGVPGEISQHGDFVGLDDLFTEHPRVVEGMIEIFGGWIDQFGIDGFRIDTARHVNPEFWQAFVPAMLERAEARGIPNFHIFGEVYNPDPAYLARFSHVDGFPALLDFAFQSVATDVIARGKGTDALAALYEADAIYKGGEEAALGLPTFLGNHDMGRFAMFVKQANPETSDEEIIRRVILGHALMMFGRGSPTIYYGDEQGFVGLEGDQAARQNMFASQVESYNAETLVGTTATTAERNFDTGHPLYAAIAEMARVRAAEPALRQGLQVTRASGAEAGLFAFSRRLDGREVLVAMNTSGEAISENVWVDATSLDWTSLSGQCAPQASAPGSVRVDLAPYSYVVCVSEAAA